MTGPWCTANAELTGIEAVGNKNQQQRGQGYPDQQQVHGSALATVTHVVEQCEQGTTECDDVGNEKDNDDYFEPHE